jgi:hypothetical protein
MKLLLAAAFLSPLALGVAGCASNGVEQYRAEQPALDLKTYLNGTLDAWGIFQGRSGEVKKRFHVVIEAQVGPAIPASSTSISAGRTVPPRAASGL